MRFRLPLTSRKWVLPGVAVVAVLISILGKALKPSLAEPRLDLTRPEAMAQLREAVWVDERRSNPRGEAAWVALGALPSADAMALTAVSRPMFRIHEDIWTGRIRLDPTRDLEVVLVSQGERPLATIYPGGDGDYVHIYSADDPDIAVRAAAMQPGEQLVERWPPIASPPYWIVRGDQAEEIASQLGPPGRTVPIADLVIPYDEGAVWPSGWKEAFLKVMATIIGLLAIALRPWRRAADAIAPTTGDGGG